jgi:hypothetical protein
MHRERSGWEMRLLLLRCKERKRVHPNMVPVRD